MLPVECQTVLEIADCPLSINTARLCKNCFPWVRSGQQMLWTVQANTLSSTAAATYPCCSPKGCSCVVVCGYCLLNHNAAVAIPGAVAVLATQSVADSHAGKVAGCPHLELPIKVFKAQVGSVVCSTMHTCSIFSMLLTEPRRGTWRSGQ